MCKDKNKQTWGIRLGKLGMKEQTKIKIKDEPTYSSGRNITILASATKKTEVISHGMTEWKGKKAKTKLYKLQRIREIIFVIYLMRVSCVL